MTERADQITLYCEDYGRSERILNAALQALGGALPLALAVEATGAGSKNDLQARLTQARAKKQKAIAIRDRDFLEHHLVNERRGRAFAKENPSPWPLSRHCIESYLLDEALLNRVSPMASLGPRVRDAANARRWLDVGRATLDDAHYRLQEGLRKHRKLARRPLPQDRASALAAVEASLRAASEAAAETFVASVAERLDAFAAEFNNAPDLTHRVDGRELLEQLQRDIGLPNLVHSLVEAAVIAPPAGLLDDVRQLLEAIPTPKS